MQNKYIPLIISLFLLIGFYIGRFVIPVDNKIINTQVSTNKQSKLINVLDYIESEYVDTIAKGKLEDEALYALIEQLDPHSSYFSKSELISLSEPLEGEFDGIGVEFSIENDTIVVVSPIIGGPSESIGVKAGDRIVKVNDSLIAGIGIRNSGVVKLLRGKAGSIVNISVYRRGNKEFIDFEIVRGKIPLHSVDVGYMVSDNIGYIKISRFSRNTYEEFKEKMDDLINKGMKKMILDLRGNGGGYLGAAISIADEFLQANKLIVYTEGKSRPRNDAYSTKGGDFESQPLIILVDESSASASEIVAGAIQDNDRGLIIGHRTFGKGLVQEQTMFPDSSGMRLTIARYYTPTGRCIQKSYNKNLEKYYMEAYQRDEDMEIENNDSVFDDTTKYITPKGKILYGGGGIRPDIHVKFDTTGMNSYYYSIFRKGIVRECAFNYVDKNRDVLSKYSDFKSFNKGFNIDNSMLESFVEFASNNGVERNEKQIKECEFILKTQYKALIARYLYNNEGYYPVISNLDNTLKIAIKEIAEMN